MDGARAPFSSMEAFKGAIMLLFDIYSFLNKRFLIGKNTIFYTIAEQLNIN